LALRTDPAAIRATNRLHGMRVAIAEIVDARGDKELGSHRDGLARARQYGYKAADDPTRTVRGLLELLLLVNGAEMVAARDADVVIGVDIEALTVTTDAPLAGEETFGEVQLSVRFRDKHGKTFAMRQVRKSFADDDYADPGMLGDSLREALQMAIALLPRPSGTEPGRFARTASK
jgi:hypothetical protein